MPPKRRLRSRRVASRQREATVVVDTVAGRVQTGSTTVCNVADLKMFDRSRPFRIVSVHYDIVAQENPLTINIRVYSPVESKDSVATTGLFNVRGVPKKGTLNIPSHASQFFPSSVDTQQTLVAIDGICTKTGSSTTDEAVFVLKIRMVFGPEEFPEKCPTVLSPSKTISSVHGEAVPHVIQYPGSTSSQNGFELIDVDEMDQLAIS